MKQDQPNQTRSLSYSERCDLEAALAFSRDQRNQHLNALLCPSLTLLLLLYFLWAVIYWIGWRFLDIDLGLHSAATPWIFGIVALAFLALVGPEVLATFRRFKTTVRALKADLASGTVEDITLGITEALRLQEPEHGGFLYFLRTTDERVYVQFDYESQSLAVEDQNPEKSKYQPRDTLNVVKASHDRRILASHFSGEPVPIVHKVALTRFPKDWPEPDTFSSTPWNKLISRYTTRGQ